MVFERQFLQSLRVVLTLWLSVYYATITYYYRHCSIIHGHVIVLLVDAHGFFSDCTGIECL